MQSSYNWHLKPTAAWLAWQILSLSLDLQVARSGGRHNSSKGRSLTSEQYRRLQNCTHYENKRVTREGNLEMEQQEASSTL